MSDVLRAVREQFGIVLSDVDTSGGCYNLIGRLETGHWVVATDHEFLMSLRERERYEQEEGYGIGWHVSVHLNERPEGIDQPCRYGYGGAVCYIADYEATTAELPTVIGRTLEQFVSVARHCDDCADKVRNPNVSSSNEEEGNCRNGWD